MSAAMHNTSRYHALAIVEPVHAKHYAKACEQRTRCNSDGLPQLAPPDTRAIIAKPAQ